jgi:transcriptional regulator with XRE-family HTH domain
VATFPEVVVVHPSPADQVAVNFAELLRLLRLEARLTQEELGEAAGISPRSISDLERGISRTARKDTAILLADALAIGGTARTAFIAAARGRAPVSDVLAAMDGVAANAPAATTVWYASDDEGLSLHRTRLIRLIDAMTAAAAKEGSAITGIWLIGMTAVAGSQTSSAPPEMAPGSGSFRGQLQPATD